MFIRHAVTAALVVATATFAQGQEVTIPVRTWELRVPGGALIGTGAQRDQVKDAQVTAIQLSRTVGHGVAVVGTFGWASSRDMAAVDRPKLDIFTSDIGLEACAHEWLSTKPVSISTFAGFGGGVRSYNYRKLDVDATNNLAGYVAVGSELGVRRMRIRIEARDYATGFRPLVGGGKSEARNDVVIMAGVRFNRDVK